MGRFSCGSLARSDDAAMDAERIRDPATIAAMTEESTPAQPAVSNRGYAFSEAFREFIPQGWAPYPEEPPAELPASAPAALRRRAVAEAHPGERLVIPAGGFKVRANDTDYRFRPHSAFAWLTGLGTDREPDSVLVLEPTDTGHEATLYFKPRAPRTDPEFYADSRYGEMWVGTRESLAEMTALTGISCAPISELDAALAKNVSATTVRVLAEADEAVTRRRGSPPEHHHHQSTVASPAALNASPSG
jgi:Xaa-Pro aminopeptidase